jgi:hypothetical protein
MDGTVQKWSVSDETAYRYLYDVLAECDFPEINFEFSFQEIGSLADDHLSNLPVLLIRSLLSLVLCREKFNVKSLVTSASHKPCASCQ